MIILENRYPYETKRARSTSALPCYVMLRHGVVVGYIEKIKAGQWKAYLGHFARWYRMTTGQSFAYPYGINTLIFSTLSDWQEYTLRLCEGAVVKSMEK